MLTTVSDRIECLPARPGCLPRCMLELLCEGINIEPLCRPLRRVTGVANRLEGDHVLGYVCMLHACVYYIYEPS